MSWKKSIIAMILDPFLIITTMAKNSFISVFLYLYIHVSSLNRLSFYFRLLFFGGPLLRIPTPPPGPPLVTLKTIENFNYLWVAL
ncbi:hypothetical protein CLU79DRAFT_768360 [Phycomyces nitens]|nr:hypothetical protein CLU79DRAFT_768360 [Phycomyces nitens]